MSPGQKALSQGCQRTNILDEAYHTDSIPSPKFRQSSTISNSSSNSLDSYRGI